MCFHDTSFAGSSWRSDNCVLLLGHLAEGGVLGIAGSGYVVFHRVRECGV